MLTRRESGGCGELAQCARAAATTKRPRRARRLGRLRQPRRRKLAQPWLRSKRPGSPVARASRRPHDAYRARSHRARRLMALRLARGDCASSGGARTVADYAWRRSYTAARGAPEAGGAGRGRRHPFSPHFAARGCGAGGLEDALRSVHPPRELINLGDGEPAPDAIAARHAARHRRRHDAAARSPARWGCVPARLRADVGYLVPTLEYVRPHTGNRAARLERYRPDVLIRSTTPSATGRKVREAMRSAKRADHGHHLRARAAG